MRAPCAAKAMCAQSRGCPRNCKRRASGRLCHWESRIPGKAAGDSDPRARRSATGNGHARASRAGCPGEFSPVVVQSAWGESGAQSAKIAVTDLGRLWGVTWSVSGSVSALAAAVVAAAILSGLPFQACSQSSSSRRLPLRHKLRNRHNRSSQLNRRCRRYG